ncbi:acetyltransferase [Sinomonas halotolerans]|uniref:Acetyltransferase n=1 Tax=Sinomonas halotolerans TaxID=1644133 RepID=A0ABU9WYM0_9MICC
MPVVYVLAQGENMEHEATQRVINLAQAPGERRAWDRPVWVIYMWALVELVLVTNPFQISSKLRLMVLRLFGARIGVDVIFRPRTRVKFPWKLEIGDRCWIGEGVWFHNQDHIVIGNDVSISQETLLTTGSHAYRRDMALITRPIHVADGAWITSRCVILGGTHIGVSAVISPLSLVRGQNVPDGEVWGGVPSRYVERRFSKGDVS